MDSSITSSFFVGHHQWPARSEETAGRRLGAPLSDGRGPCGSLLHLRGPPLPEASVRLMLAHSSPDGAATLRREWPTRGRNNLQLFVACLPVCLPERSASRRAKHTDAHTHTHPTRGCRPPGKRTSGACGWLCDRLCRVLRLTSGQRRGGCSPRPHGPFVGSALPPNRGGAWGPTRMLQAGRPPSPIPTSPAAAR